MTRFPQPTEGGRHAAEQRASASEERDLVTVDLGAGRPTGGAHALKRTPTPSPDARRVIAPGRLTEAALMIAGAFVLYGLFVVLP